MFDLYKRKFPEQPFPRQGIGCSMTAEDLQKMGFSDTDIASGINGHTMKDGYELEFSPAFYEKLGLDLVGSRVAQERFRQNRTTDSELKKKIAEQLDISYEAVRKFLSTGLQKLEDSGQSKKFYRLLSQYYKQSARRGIEPPEIEIIETIEISIEEV